MYFRVALAFGVLINPTHLVANPAEQLSTLLDFVHKLAREEPLNHIKLTAILPTKLNQSRTYEHIDRRDYDSHDIRFSDGSIESIEFRETGKRSIFIAHIRDGCLHVDDIEKRFKLDRIIIPNKDHFPDGVYRQSVQRWGKVSFEFVDSSKCARTVVLNAGLD